MDVCESAPGIHAQAGGEPSGMEDPVGCVRSRAAGVLGWRRGRERQRMEWERRPEPAATGRAPEVATLTSGQALQPLRPVESLSCRCLVGLRRWTGVESFLAVRTQPHTVGRVNSCQSKSSG